MSLIITFANTIKRPLIVTLDEYIYGFDSDPSNSSLTIALNGYCEKTKCDIFWIFGTYTQYFAFAIGYDDQLHIDNEQGIFTFPSPNSILHEGYFSEDITNSNKSVRRLMNWYPIINESHGATNSSTMSEFVIINDNINDRVHFNFYSTKYPNGLSVVYNQSFQTDQDFHFGIIIDRNGRESLFIESLDIYKNGQSEWQWADNNVNLSQGMGGVIYIPYTQSVYWSVPLSALLRISK